MSKNRFSMDAYSGAVIESDFFGQIIFDIAGLRTPFGNMPMLREHDRLRAVGVIDETKKAEKMFSAFGYFISSSDAEEIERQLEENFPVQASIGAWLDTIEVLEKNETSVVNGREFSGDVIVRSAFVREISAVTLGADADTSVQALSLSENDIIDVKNQRDEFLNTAFSLTAQPQLKNEIGSENGDETARLRAEWRPVCGPLAAELRDK